MSKWTSEEVRAMSDSMAIYWSRCESRFVSVAMLNDLAERIALDEAAVPVNGGLLPCPFCGGERIDFLEVRGRCIECQGCGASGPELRLGGHRQDMENAWNTRRRNPPAQPPIDLAAIREVISDLVFYNSHWSKSLADKLSRAIGDTP